MMFVPVIMKRYPTLRARIMPIMRLFSNTADIPTGAAAGSFPGG